MSCSTPLRLVLILLRTSEGDMAIDGWFGETPLAGKAKDIEAGLNQSGELEIFYIGQGGVLGNSGGLYRNRQTAASSQANNGSQAWTGETPFSGDKAKRLCVGTNQNGILEIFYIGGNGVLYHNRQSAPNSDFWTGETALQPDANRVAVARNKSGQLQVFYIAQHTSEGLNYLYTTWQQSPNSTIWEGGEKVFFAGSGVDGNYPQDIAVALNSAGELEIVFTDDENYINYATQTATLGNFTEVNFFGEDSAKQFVLGQNANGLLELVYVGQNNDLYHRRQVSVTNDTWGSETSFAGAKAREVAVALNHNGILEIFYRGMGDDLYHNWQLTPNGTGWQGETAFPGAKATSLTVGTNQDGRLEIFYAGEGDNIYHNWQTTIPYKGPVNTR